VDFSLPAVLTGVLVSLATWISYTLLARQPGGYAELGLFHAASKLQVVLMFIPHTPPGV